MGIFDGCLLACDVDGTLVVSEYLPPKNIEALEYFKSEGGTLCLATGRTAGALDLVTKQYGGFGPSVVSNGSMIYDIENDSVLYKTSLTESDKKTALDILKICPTVACELHSGKQVIVISRTSESDDHEEYENIPTLFLDKSEIFNYDLEKILFLFSPGSDEKTVTDYISTIEHTCHFTPSACTIKGIKRRYLEVLPNGVSKAKSLGKLCEIKNIDRKKVFAIGDYFNDLPMLKFANISACPSESPDEIKEQSTFVVCSARDGAVADFIDILKGEILNGRTN